MTERERIMYYPPEVVEGEVVSVNERVVVVKGRGGKLRTLSRRFIHDGEYAGNSQ